MSEQTTLNLVRAVGYTDVGQRSHNEDSFLVDESTGLMVVADGVGGHEAGEVASAITCQVLQREVMAGASLEQGIRAANVEVFDAVVRELGRAGMASTVVALHFHGTAWSLAWVGDSRAYLWDGQLGLLSQDHSLVESLIQTGQISLEEARTHPKKNVIDQAIGLQAQDSLRIGTNRGELLPDQVLLLCSDGLNDALNSARISEILSSSDSLDVRCRQLVQSAVDDGGRDNTTVILLEAGSGAATSRNDAIPEFTWRYDPVTDSYAGLPEFQGGKVPPLG
jgi:serine/threonine protein phosphatase PrpC